MIQETIKDFLQQHHISRDAGFILAVSGGADSICMLHAFKYLNLKMLVLHCNFSLRGKESDMDEQFVKRFCDSYGIAHSVKKFDTLKYARENDVPCLGICLGMQCMVIEFARDVMGLTEANSTEMEVSTKHNVIDLMESQKSVSNMGGTMRLGEYDCVLDPDSKTAKAYQSTHIKERHRHRFEFNSEYRDKFEAAGMMCVGENPESNLVEVVEIPALKWFVGVQFHPEYNSTVVNPNPLFVSFVKAAVENKK